MIFLIYTYIYIHTYMIGFERSVVPTVLSNRKNESGLILGACYSQDGSAVYTGIF